MSSSSGNASVSSNSLASPVPSEKIARKRRFITWGHFKSTDSNNPDVVIVIPQSYEIFATEYSLCTYVSWLEDESWMDAVLPLQAHSSQNTSLITPWKKAIQDGRLEVGEALEIRTWLDTSRNGRTIRRFRLVF